MKVWWCEEHLTDSVVSSTDAVGKWMGIVPDVCWYWRFLRSDLPSEKPCRFVEKLLADDGLVVEKVNGEWPEWAIASLASSLGGSPGRGMARALLESLMESFNDEMGLG